MTRLERFKAKTVPDTDTGCVEWVGFVNKTYGWFWVPGGPVFAHRWIYEQLVGPIPEGRHLDHLCRNRTCVNPAHLEPVTQATNTLRGVSFSAINARKTHCYQGHEFTPENTSVYRGTRRCITCRRARVQRQRQAARSSRSTS